VRQLRGEVGPAGRKSPGQEYYVVKPSPNQELISEAINLWDPERNIGLDASSEENIMRRAKCLPTMVKLARPGVVDIKSAKNIHSWDKLLTYGGTEIPWERVVPELKQIEQW